MDYGHRDWLFFCFQFFTTKPYACEPSSLPKYPPSKEMDAKLRDEEARRWDDFNTLNLIIIIIIISIGGGGVST